jgi:hypothetical protein
MEITNIIEIPLRCGICLNECRDIIKAVVSFFAFRRFVAVVALIFCSESGSFVLLPQCVGLSCPPFILFNIR